MYFKENECLVEGPLNNLKQSMVQFQKPRKIISERVFTLGGMHLGYNQPPMGNMPPGVPTMVGIPMGPGRQGPPGAVPFMYPGSAPPPRGARLPMGPPLGMPVRGPAMPLPHSQPGTQPDGYQNTMPFQSFHSQMMYPNMNQRRQNEYADYQNYFNSTQVGLTPMGGTQMTNPNPQLTLSQPLTQSQSNLTTLSQA